ncbi:unnamed protein product [Pedinophyceae sp. YPF-701]|nr:unnamed protein product [Pedinophyceae sp. YPF-701]
MAVSVRGGACARLAAGGAQPSQTHCRAALARLPAPGAQLQLRSVRPFESAGARRRSIIAAAWGDPVEWKPCKVVRSERAAQDLTSITLDVGERSSGYTTAGQFLQLKVGDSKPAFIAVASPPRPSSEIDLLIKSQGGTSDLLCALQAGEEADGSAIMGKGFPVGAVSAEDAPTVLLFATGSGISPIKALIESGQLSGRKARLYYGARCADSMAFQDLFDAWRSAGVEVTPVFSNPADGWAGATGYVQDAVKADLGAIDGASTVVVLCGQKEMVEGVKEVLTPAGVPEDRFLLNF